jgi:hypothetical protein
MTILRKGYRPEDYDSFRGYLLRLQRKLMARRQIIFRFPVQLRGNNRLAAHYRSCSAAFIVLAADGAPRTSRRNKFRALQLKFCAWHAASL